MPKKSLNTTNSQIKAALRQLFLRSRERGRRIKGDNYTCQKCGAKQSKAKGKELYVEVHHKKPIDSDWDIMFKCIRNYLLVHPDEMVTLCKECHKNAHKKVQKL